VSDATGTTDGASAGSDGTTRTADPTFASSWRRQRLDVSQRVDRGKQARKDAPRSSHGKFEAAPDRPDPIAVLERQGRERVPELVPIRYGRMLVSPFTFYRGAAAIMSHDLAPTPTSKITVQLCGDAHLSNFGVFGTPERRMIFDINDFDETLPGPWEWDVKRLAASFEIMGRYRGYARVDRRDLVKSVVRAYRERLREVAYADTLQVWYEHLEIGELLDLVRGELKEGRLAEKSAARAEDYVAKARTRDNLRVFTRRVGRIGDELRIVADPPLIVPIEDLVVPGSEWEQSDVHIKELLAAYRRTLSMDHHPLEEFHYVHAARKVVGVGSVGTRCYILLLIGRDERDPLMLQAKEAVASVLEPFAGQSVHRQHGQRVVAGQRLMQGASDMFLGWQTIRGLDGVTRDYYIRQLHDWKGSADPEVMLYTGALLYGAVCGSTLARAHARWGDRIAIASYLGAGDVFDDAIADFSAAYADQNERDYEALVTAVRTGRLVAETGL
jgi:uncharacterized protein (DUF2252 family)